MKIKPSQNNTVYPTRKNDIKTQMRANINNKIHSRGPQQSEVSSSAEEIQLPTRRKKHRYLIDSDNQEQLRQVKHKRSKYPIKNDNYYPQDSILRQSLNSKGKKQLTIIEAYDQRQQQSRNGVPNPPILKNFDFSRKPFPYNLSLRPQKQLGSSNNNIYAMGDKKNGRDQIVNDITRKIRMDLNAKRRR